MRAIRSTQADTIRANLLRTVHRHPERPAITYAVDGDGIRCRWHTLTWHEVARLVAEVCRELDTLCEPGCTVAVLATTDARYPVLEQAVAVTGRRLQPLYTSTGDDELVHAMSLTAASVLVVGDDQRSRVKDGPLGQRHGRPEVIHLSDLVRLPGCAGRELGLFTADTEPFDTEQVRAALSRWPERGGTDAMLYLQTTGTTGPARVIEISQSAVLAAVNALPADVMTPHPVLLSFLPTAHISERLLSGYVSVALAGHTWFGNGTDTLATDLVHCKPTVFLAPPLVLDAIRSEATTAASRTPLGRLLLRSATADAEKTYNVTGASNSRRRWRTRVFGRLVRRQCGLGHVKIALAGTAPLATELHAWWETIGLRLRNVYGQTEVSGATSITAPLCSKCGGVGSPVRGLEVKVGDQNELLVRGPSLFTRYLGDEQATARSFDAGWFKTGDRVEVADNGDLRLLGRVQSMIPTAETGFVNLDDLARRITSRLGAADIAYFHDETGVYLYIAVHPEGVPRHVLIESAALEPIAPTDPVAAALHAELRNPVSDYGIVGIGLFRGGFGYRHGEIGPTGKPRGWRIHQMRSAHLVRPDTMVATA